MNTFGSKAVLKRNLKEYLTLKGYTNLKQNSFVFELTNVILILMESLLKNCIEFVEKNETNGIYNLKMDVLKIVILENYDFLNKYKSFNNLVLYKNNMFFNIDLLYSYVENIIGNKLMIDNMTKNYINYLLMSFQYDVVNLSCLCIDYSGRKTLSSKLLLTTLNFFIENKNLFNLINIKLDCVKDKEEDNDDNVNETIVDSH